MCVCVDERRSMEKRLDDRIATEEEEEGSKIETRSPPSKKGKAKNNKEKQTTTKKHHRTGNVETSTIEIDSPKVHARLHGAKQQD